ncbi:MAG: hypothetical protein ACJAVS_001470, partial [Paracoccaceae bacterium]
VSDAGWPDIGCGCGDQIAKSAQTGRASGKQMLRLLGEGVCRGRQSDLIVQALQTGVPDSSAYVVGDVVDGAT